MGFFWIIWIFGGFSKILVQDWAIFRDSMGFDSNSKDSFRILSKILWHSWQFVQILREYSRFYGIVRDFSLFFGILEGLLKDFLKFGLKFDGYGMVLDGFGWFWYYKSSVEQEEDRRNCPKKRKRVKDPSIRCGGSRQSACASAHPPNSQQQQQLMPHTTGALTHLHTELHTEPATHPHTEK